MAAVIAPLLPEPPHDVPVIRLVDSVRRAPLRVKSRLSTRKPKYDDMSYPNGVLASCSTRHHEQEMAV